MSERPERKEIIKKHSAAIHIQNNITLLQRRAWNVLLYHAYDELPHHERHHVSTQALIDQLEFGSKNEAYLREALEALVGCQVKWNVLDKDGEWEWGVTTLLAEAKIKGGVCTYAYGPTLRERLYSPTMYAKIDLSIQNQFGSKHAQALWEICVDYLHEARGAGETPFIPLAKYRELMGIHDSQYPRFKEFNRRVIKEPVEEINEVTDFYVEVAFKRESRKVSAVKFKIRREIAPPGHDERQESLFPDLKDMPEAVRILKDAGLGKDDAWKIFQQGWDYVNEDKRPGNLGNDAEKAFNRYIREKVHLLKARKKDGKLTSVTGFLIKAIRENYFNPAFAEEQAAATAERKHQAHLKQEKKCEELTQQLSQLETERIKVRHKTCLEIFKSEKKLFDEASTYVLKYKQQVIRFTYEESLTPWSNYCEGFYFYREADDWLESKQPEAFENIRKQFDPQIEALKKQLADKG
jgi:hypothetical protein